MKVRIVRCLVAALALWLTLEGWATPLGPALPFPDTALPKLKIDAQVIDSPGEGPRQIHGEIAINFPNLPQEVCLYLPYNDPEYGSDRGAQGRLDALSSRAPLALFVGGSTRITTTTPHKLEPVGEAYLVKITSANGGTPVGPIALSFESSVPRLPNTSMAEWFYDGFYPQLVRSCPDGDLDSYYHRQNLHTEITADITLPDSEFVYLGPGEPAGSKVQISIRAQTLAFGLATGLSKGIVHAENTTIEVFQRTPQFSSVVNTAIAALPELTKILGPFPYSKLTLVETLELQRHSLPGLIAIDKPKQAVVHQLEREFLNWRHWILVNQLARQWYGGIVSASSMDDEWLLSGIAEFATLETLRKLPHRFNLFSVPDSGIRWLSFDFLQIDEITAATLAKYAPFSRLTDENMASANRRVDQHGLLFIKHAFAMRQINSYTGDSQFRGFLRNLTRAHWYKPLSPEDFVTHLTKLPSPFSPSVRAQALTFLKSWWTSRGFPDFALEEFETQELPNGRYLAKVTASSLGEVDFPPVIGIIDSSGRQYYVRASRPADVSDANVWQAEVLTAYEPTEASVDPLHEAFDVDRFNNASSRPGIHFFPGGARTLADDDYTLLWLPYPFRRPGEPFSLGLQAALFRYIQGNVFVKAEVAPATGKHAFEIRHRYHFWNAAVHGDLLASSNYDGDRLMEASAIRSPLWDGSVNISLGGHLRRRDHAGIAGSAHFSNVISLGIRPKGLGPKCGFHIYGEHENAPRQWSHGFSYQRSTAAGNLSCAWSTSFATSVRLFRGALLGDGEIPEGSLFKPNDVREAKIRIDLSGLNRSKQIFATNLDFQAPLYLPLPDDIMILSRQMRSRIFMDYGRSLDLDTDYRAAGLGALMPMGGDISGAGALSFTQMSLLFVLYSEAGEVSSRRPGILFDLSGEI